ncbi:polyprenyl synthetase family protein [Erythrobacter sp. SD-21]|uniref:polyprenyl synthetase family protein n=1 Tax=Erythrobacter sp. SD-21 TaxID=161528 RepID=UPI000153FAFC|nr:polyprenyl synthetase family protein [Erythrobacter sp. SD-21]EDL49991.1 Polyprenyl synthetase [Erythrobacter sp. SD-21]
MNANTHRGFDQAHRDAADLLVRFGKETRLHLDHYLRSGNDAPYLDALLAEYPKRGGKMLRPGICIANALIFGGELTQAARCAAAVELLHNALLIHDDVQDESDLRRGLPTLHAQHGVALAINAGDALLFTAFQPLLDAIRPLGADLAQRVIEVTIAMARQTAEGQALELGWRDRNVTELTEADYLRMALKKTAWMGMIWPAQLGVLMGGRGRIDPARVVRFGHFLGLAFQIEDDLRNLTDNPGYGKERNGDLYEGKRTLMLIHVRNACEDADRARIDRLMDQPRADRDPAEIDWLARLMNERGSIRHARQVADAMAGVAMLEFKTAYSGLSDSAELAFLEVLPSWVFDRP